MAWPTPADDGISMDDPETGPSATADDDGGDTTAFELTPSDVKVWLNQEKKFVQLMAKRRLQEATELAEAYVNGLLSSEEAAGKWTDYHSRWPGRICLDRKTEEEIEDEATGMEKDPTGVSIYRPRRPKRRQLVTMTSLPA